MGDFLKNATEWLRGYSKTEAEDVIFILSFGSLVVGYLRYENDVWIFEYAKEFKDQDELKPVIGFPDLEEVYKSEELWPFFALRIPSMAQPAVQKYLAQQNLETVDEATMLREFGQQSVANPFELELQEN